MGSGRRKDTDAWDRLATREDGFSRKGIAAEARASHGLGIPGP
jgi:hypothetical protein